MAKKFDTNPLDPNFPESVRTQSGDTLETEKLPQRPFADPVDHEKETSKLSDVRAASIGADKTDLQPRSIHAVDYPENSLKKDTKIKIGSIFLPENILTMLPYVPISFIGIIAAIVELVLVPRSEPRVRYHAAQGLAAQLGFWVLIMILEAFGAVSDLADWASTGLAIFSTIILAVFAFKAWQGKPIHIASVQDLTDWLEEKIAPKE